MRWQITERFVLFHQEKAWKSWKNTLKYILYINMVQRRKKGLRDKNVLCVACG